jgi:hypothetical protein
VKIAFGRDTSRKLPTILACWAPSRWALTPVLARVEREVRRLLAFSTSSCAVLRGSRSSDLTDVRGVAHVQGCARMKVRLQKDDSATIGFVIDCVFSDAINLDELRDWADHVIGLAPVFPSAEYPSWLVDLSSFSGTAKDLFATIGFAPHRGLKKNERHALTGIACARGRSPSGDGAPSPEKARAALEAAPHIRAEFVATFPFLATFESP